MLALSAFAANSATYQVSVVLNVENTPLEITQSKVMVFPELLINEVTEEGWACAAQPTSSEFYTKLCPDNSGAQVGQFIIKGTPNAMVTYTFTGGEQEQDGIKFHSKDLVNSKVLNTEGLLYVSDSGTVSLTDKALAMSKPGTRTFTYDFTAAYQ